VAAGSWDEYFGKRTWRVATEVTAVDAVGPQTTVTFSKGRFSIDGGVFHSPLSSARGTRGILLQETAPDGSDIAGSRVAVGVVVYRKARREGAVK
jgi:hypothetical protein